MLVCVSNKTLPVLSAASRSWMKEDGRLFHGRRWIPLVSNNHRSPERGRAYSLTRQQRGQQWTEAESSRNGEREFAADVRGTPARKHAYRRLTPGRGVQARIYGLLICPLSDQPNVGLWQSPTRALQWRMVCAANEAGHSREGQRSRKVSLRQSTPQLDHQLPNHPWNL